MIIKNNFKENKEENDSHSKFIKEIELSLNIQNKFNDERINLKTNDNNEQKNKLVILNSYKLKKNELSELSKEIKENRNFGIDIGRILAIFFIINHHIIYHGGLLFKTKALSFDNNFLIFFNTIFCSGVNMFGMISGFVGFRSHKFSNLIYLLFQTFIYNYGIAFFFKKTRPKIVKDLNNYLYPLFISDYWYFNAYFTMYFFLPLLNLGINNMKKREMGIFNLSLFLLFSCFNQIRHYSNRFTKDIFFFMNGFSYMWLIILYFYGSYFGRFKNDFHPHKKYVVLFVNLIKLFFIAFIRSFLIIYKNLYQKKGIQMIVEYTSPSSVIISIYLITILSKPEINNKISQKTISFLAPLTYGVYLIHNHKLVRNYVIKNRYSWILKSNSVILIIMVMFQSLKIFFYCSFIDYIRLLFFKMLKIKKICIIISNLFKIIFDKILLFFELYY